MKALVTRGIALCLVLLLGAVSPVFASEPMSENLLKNGSFEEVGEDGKPVSFGFGVYEGDAKVTVDSTVARTGQNSVQITGDGKSRGLFGTSVAVEGGKAYRASVWYRTTDSVAIGSVILRVMAYHDQVTSDDTKERWQAAWLLDPFEGEFQVTGPNLHVHNWRAAVDDWGLLTVSFTVPDEVVALRIEGFNWYGDGHVWFDDVSLVELE